MGVNRNNMSDHDVTFEKAAKTQNHEFLEKDQARKKLQTVYSALPKVSVVIAPMYTPYFGKIMHVMINGISCAIPCDGRPYDVPSNYADEVNRRLMAVNDQQSKQKRCSDIARNVESAPGELTLF